MAPNTEKVEFPGASGESLSARLDSPIAPPIAYALFAHCFTCSKDSRAAAYVAAALAERGIACLRFGFPGLGGSGGEFGNTNFPSSRADLVAAVDFLRRRYRAPALLVGHSLGGAAVLAAAREVPEVAGVATIAAPSDPAHVLALIPNRDEIERIGEAEVVLGGRTFRIRRQLLDDLAGQRQDETLRSLGKALLVMHSPRDDTVAIDNATRIFLGARHPKSFVSLDPADHLLARHEDAAYAGHVIAAWAERYLRGTGPAAPAPVADKVVVRETREGKFTQLVAAGHHVLRADEPVSAGGLGSGPAPYDLLLAALGTCTSMTLRSYADLKDLPLERVEVELKHDKIHAADCAECETGEAKIDRIERVIRLEGALDAAQRAKLLEIANRCPVHRTLESEVKVASRLVEPG